MVGSGAPEPFLLKIENFLVEDLLLSVDDGLVLIA